jgi:uncharacterized membrane protein
VRGTAWVMGSSVGWLLRAWHRLKGGYWLIPLTCVAVAVSAAFGLIAFDRYLQDRDRFSWTYAGGPQNASDTLTTIASSMITFTGLVFSITVLALQLTSSQFSPRALRNFLRDRVAQFALGIFIATFAYSFAALSAVRVASDDGPPFVPGVTVTGAFVLIGVSIIMFVQYIHHTAQSIRAVTIIERVAHETRATIDDMYPVSVTEPLPEPGPVAERAGRGHEVAAPGAGVIVDIDLDGLAGSVTRHDGACVEVLHPVGAFVCEGQPLMRVWTTADTVVDWAVLQPFVLRDTERTMRADAAFGLRQLVDIAERAMSPGVNDPTTAVQCLDRIHDVLRRLSTRHIPVIHTGVCDGTVRAIAPGPSFDDLVGLGTEEVWHWGRESIQVQARLRSLLDDLIAATAEQAGRCTALRARAESLAAVPLPPAWPPRSPRAPWPTTG